MKTKYHCETLLPWLRANGHQLGCLTGQSSKALAAAVQCVALWSYSDSQGERCAVEAFGACVRAMPTEQRYLAYHAIAHVTDWGQRGKLWSAAGLEPVRCGRCTHEPQDYGRTTVEAGAFGNVE